MDEVAVCKFCKEGNLRFFESVYSNGIAKHYFLVCNKCNMSTDFYTLPKQQNSSESDKKVMFGHNLLQILGASLSGIGKSGIDTLNTLLGLSPISIQEIFLPGTKILIEGLYGNSCT